MLNSIGELCGYIYITSTNSFVFNCALCGNCFKSLKEFQNHNLKVHFQINSVDQDQDIDYKDVPISISYSENIENEKLLHDQTLEIFRKSVEKDSQAEVKESFVEIEKINFNNKKNELHENHANKQDDSMSSSSSTDNEKEKFSFLEQPEIDEPNENLIGNSNMLPFNVNDLDKINLKCKYCKKRFSKIDNLIQHTKNHLNFLLTCKFCGKHSYRRSHALSHEKIHSKLKCDVKFSSEVALETHLYRHEKLKCKFCSKVFKKVDIENHLRTHTEEKPYECGDCPADFAIKKNFQNRIATQHTGDIKNFACEFCEKKFKTKQLHSIHTKKVHLKEKQLVCEFCDKAFETTSGLRRHKLKNHPVDKISYDCLLFDKKFDESGKLTSNITTDSGAKPAQNDKVYFKVIAQDSDVENQERLSSNFSLDNLVSEENEERDEKLMKTSSTELNVDFDDTENFFNEEYSNQNYSLLSSPSSDLEEGKEQKYSSMVTEIVKDDEAIDESEEKKALTILPFGLNDLDEVNLQCKYCKKQFSTRVNLIQHTKDHLNYILTCKICGKHSSRKSHAHSHDKTHTKIKCDLCDARFSNERVLEKHLKRHEMLKCKFCSKIFKKCDAIQNHLRTHTGEKPYKCDVCSAAFAIKKNLQTHIITQHTGDIKNFACKFCDRRFKTKQLRDWHTKRVHLKEKPHQCEFCGLNFANMSGLRRHKLKRHTEYSKRPHPCRLCDKKFVELKNLTEHMNTHTGEKPFQCNICSKNFGQQSSLREHKKLHTGKKTHICKICGKAFAQHSGCSNHMKQHHMITNII